MMDAEAPVKDPTQFVGHVGLVRRIFSRIGAERPQSVAVIGGKKSGKTSLLAYISDEEVRRRHLEGAESFHFVSVCAGSEMAQSPDSFLAAFASLFPGAAGAENRYEAVRRVVDRLHTEGRRLVVLLDDFHFITRNTAFPLEFFSFLRSMANNYNLAYVTTSFLELQKLCVVKDVQESPFFNIFTNLPLGMLDSEEAQTLFERSTGLGRELAGKIAAWCGNSAYLVKKAGARLLGADSPENLGEADLEHMLLPEVSPYFLEVVSLLPPEAARPLQSIARGRSPELSEVHHVSPLVKQGFLGERNGEVVCVCPAFMAFLHQGFNQRILKGMC